MPTLSADSLLYVWEMGRTRHPVDRALLLFAWAVPAGDTDSLADVPLGQRNAALLALRRTMFGNRLRCRFDCAQCDERFEFELDVDRLLPDEPRPVAVDASIDVAGLRFRLPTSRDLASVAGLDDIETAALYLLRRCRLDEPSGSAETTALSSVIEAAEAAFECADPCADLTLAMRCEACGHAWQAPFDIAAVLWEEIEDRAQGLLNDVHLIASAYGWREREILALSETRRAAYLARVLA